MKRIKFLNCNLDLLNITETVNLIDDKVIDEDNKKYKVYKKTKIKGNVKICFKLFREQ